MKKLTVQDYAKLTGVSHTIVYRKIKKGELATKTETINNRETTVILLDDNDLLQEQGVSNSFKPSRETQYETFETPGETSINFDFIGDIIQDNKEMRRELLDLSKKYFETAQLAGQAKLLTDSEHRTKEEYFQVIQENATLRAKLELQQQKLNESQKEIENKAELKATLDLKTQQLEELKQKLEVKESKVNSWWRKL